MGTIVIPVFIEQTENAKEALETSDFKPIWDVLEALKSHDDRLSDELDRLRIELGAKTGRSIGATDLERIVFDMPGSVDENFVKSLRTVLVEQTTESWMFWYGLLLAYAKEHGHCRVHLHFKTVDGHRLGQWLAQKRLQKDRMEPDRRKRLEELPGWSWNVTADRWEVNFARLMEFVEREGHCRVPKGYTTNDGFKLDSWVKERRKYKDAATVEQRKKLESLPGWSWNVLDARWEENFSELLKFAKQEGHCRVPKGFGSKSGSILNVWVQHQRSYKDKLDLGRRRRLEALPGWSWQILSDQWELGFDQLSAFSKREGHCRVVGGFTTENGFRLGAWVASQRIKKNQIKMDRRQRLEALPGWSWSVLTEQWDAGFLRLKQYFENVGSSRVSGTYKTADNYPLGSWVSTQRKNAKRLEPGQKQRLELLLDWSWDAFTDKWEENFFRLKRFADEHGHCRVPMRYKAENSSLLGRWVGVQRTAKSTMTSDRRGRLESLPSWSWDANADKWEEGFSRLVEYIEREGHSWVPKGYKCADGYKLHNWVRVQRGVKGKLEQNRRKRLEELPHWTWNTRKVLPMVDQAALKIE